MIATRSKYSRYSRDCLRRDLVAVVRQALDHIVIAVLVRDEERTPQRTIVGIQSILGKYLLIVIKVVVIYRAVERHYYHLRRLESIQHAALMLGQMSLSREIICNQVLEIFYLFRMKTAGNDCAISGTEAIRKLADRRVAALGQICRRLGDRCWC